MDPNFWRMFQLPSGLSMFDWGLEPTSRYKAVISAHTGNTFAGDLPRVADGFELTHGWSLGILGFRASNPPPIVGLISI